jgi:hypothetical protein
MDAIDINKLTPEQKQALRMQIEAEDRAREEQAKKLRDDYEQMKDDEVRMAFEHLQRVSAALAEEKVNVFNQFGALLAMKRELYGLTDERLAMQQSHTFTSSDGRRSVIIGSNVIDRWGDDVQVGIDRVISWINSRISDKNSRDIIMALLKPDSKGVLKANRVLELSKKAAEIGDTELIDAVSLIRDQYRPEKTSTYVKAKYMDEHGQWQWLALSMSAV